MAAQSSQQQLRKSPTSSRWSTSSTSFKLRDSCHACASSKVRCSKEKPVCSRCLKRGTSCEYLITKRPGRKHENRASIDANSISPAMSVTTQLSQSQPSTLVSLDAPMIPLSTSSRAPSLISPYQDIMQHSLSSDITSLSSEFDEFFASPSSFPMSDNFDFDVPIQPHISSVAESIISSSSSNDTFSRKSSCSSSVPPEDAIYLFGEPPNSPMLLPPCATAPSQFSANDFGIPQDALGLDASCCCLIGALDIMKRLCRGDTLRCATPRIQAYEKYGTHLLPTVQSVISMNERILDDVTNLLKCPCSKNSFLLTILSLIICKVLNWYTTAARTSAISDEMDMDRLSPASPCSSVQWLDNLQNGDQLPAIPGSNNSADDPDSGRMAAQLVLGELHRVQRFLNLLSPKLRACGGKKDISNPAETDSMSTSSGSAFSSAVLDQLEPEMRKRVRALSMEIIEILRWN